MKHDKEELERPNEWLKRLREDSGRYRSLVEDAGSFALAAYRIARATGQTRPMPCAVPTARELWVAATELQHYIGDSAPALPADLAADCEAAGVPVIVPLKTNRAA